MHTMIEMIIKDFLESKFPGLFEYKHTLSGFYKQHSIIDYTNEHWTSLCGQNNWDWQCIRFDDQYHIPHYNFSRLYLADPEFFNKLEILQKLR